MPDALSDDFDGAEPDAYWSRTLLGGGTLTCAGSTLRLALPAVRAAQYGDAQIDDYGRRRAGLRWRPPVRMDVRARMSHPQQAPGEPDGGVTTLRGTAGFGFWNYPFTPTGGVLTLPDAVWFFYASQPSDMALVPGVPGHGWKAQVVHAHRLGALGAVVPTLGAMLWGRASGRNGSAERWVHRLSGAREAHIGAPLTEWHDYALEWAPDRARFWVDGAEVLTATEPPRGPLGFVAWVDNQYAVATPRGVLRFGALPTEAEWMELAHVRVTQLG